MSTNKDEINALTYRLQQAILPILADSEPEVALPAMLQLTVLLAMHSLGCSHLEAAASIVQTLQNAKRGAAN